MYVVPRGFLGLRKLLGVCLVRGQVKSNYRIREWEIKCLLAAIVTQGMWSTQIVSLLVAAHSKNNGMWKYFRKDFFEEDLTVVRLVF